MLKKISLLAIFLASAPAPAALAASSGFGFYDPSLSGSYLAGRAAGKQRDLDQAAQYYAEALIGDPGNPVLIERAFGLDLASGNLDKAEAGAAEVIGFNSKHRLANLVLGLKNLRAANLAKSREHFKAAAYTPAGELTSALLTAWAFAGDAKPVEAYAALDVLDGNESFANFKSYHLALLSDHFNDPERATRNYEKAFEAASGSLRLVQAYGNFLVRQGKRGEAAKVYTKFLEVSENNPIVLKALEAVKTPAPPARFVASAAAGAGEALFSLASALASDQGLDVALAYSQLALSLTADSDVARTLLGDIYEDMLRYEDANAAYESVPSSSPLRTNAEIEIAVNLQRLERHDEALAKLNAVLAREPQNYEAAVTLGNLQRSNEKFAEAAAAYSKAIGFVAVPQKQHWSLFYYRAIALERMKQWPQAEADFRKALALDPDQALVLNYLGYSMIDQKINLNEAIEMVKRAVDLKPNDGYIVDSLGWAHYQLGEYEEAVRQLERAVELKPADPIIADHLGDAYWRAGRTLEARFQWQHSKDNKPEPAELVKVEAKLKNGLPALEPAKPAENKATGGNG